MKKLLLVATATALVFGGCAELEKHHLVTFTPEQTRVIREMAGDQVKCSQGLVAHIAGVKDRRDKITLDVRCE